MTPDIREKAERLAGAAPLHIRIQPEGVSFDADPYADIISQALLEAHKAGRAEERERVVGLVSRQKFAADLDGSTGDQYDQGYADASQGDWETTRRELLTAIRSIT